MLKQYDCDHTVWRQETPSQMFVLKELGCNLGSASIAPGPRVWQIAAPSILAKMKFGYDESGK